MFSDAIVTAADDVFGSPQLGLELIAASALCLAILFYIARVAWIALADARRMELKAVVASAGPRNPAAYAGSAKAG